MMNIDEDIETDSIFLDYWTIDLRATLGSPERYKQGPRMNSDKKLPVGTPMSPESIALEGVQVKIEASHENEDQRIVRS